MTAPSNKPHKWETGSASWLNGANGEKTCTVCGVSLLGGFVNAGHPTSDPGLSGVKGSKLYTYRDIKGNVFTSTKPLGCPAFMMDAASAAMENRGYIRETNEKVGAVEVTVGVVNGRLTALEEENGDRLDALEQENVELRAMLQETQARLRRLEVQAASKSDLPPLISAILGDTESREKVVEQIDIIPIRRYG